MKSDDFYEQTKTIFDLPRVSPMRNRRGDDPNQMFDVFGTSGIKYLCTLRLNFNGTPKIHWKLDCFLNKVPQRILCRTKNEFWYGFNLLNLVDCWVPFFDRRIRMNFGYVSRRVARFRCSVPRICNASWEFYEATKYHWTFGLPPTLKSSLLLYFARNNGWIIYNIQYTLIVPCIV